VFGVPAEIYCDPQAAAEIEEGRGLVPCGGDDSDLADRWDARCAWLGCWVCWVLADVGVGVSLLFAV